ncbi:pickpocket protein 11-like [Contarinia nasturtii]|uniref:pickpocket protein 11-like n=1 Tax=Contarinia nasturtii TaxID=265458 RepID=UPI0012D3C7D5|nr:pickpocket protein 11-like [Contarinia nasturtii]
MDSEGRDEAFFLKGIRHLGKLYDFEQSESFDLLGFQRILDQLEEHFDVASKLETLQVYNPNEVPDQFASEALISSGSETLVKIGANRRCMFSSDIAQIQSDPYFRSNCIRSCRLDSIIALCGCIPFFYLDLKPLLTNSTNVCTLDKLHCLNHFHVKWQTLLFSREKSVGVETEFENGLSCLQCLPSCSQTQYSISTTRLPLRTLPIQTRNMTRFGRDAVANSELIMLRLFYARPDHFLYRQYVAKNWFELLSELGGLSGVIIGFSLISVIEVLYFMVKQFYSAIQNHNHRRYSEKVKQGRNFIFFS